MEPPKPSSVKESKKPYYYVRIKYSVWPDIYGEEIPIHFPTLTAALRFAENNCNSIKPQIRVFNDDDIMIKRFNYQD